MREEELGAWSRHFDTLKWAVAAMLLAANVGLIGLADAHSRIRSIAGLILTAFLPIFIHSFRALEARVQKEAPGGNTSISKLARSPIRIKQIYLVWVLTVLLAAFWAFPLVSSSAGATSSQQNDSEQQVGRFTLFSVTHKDGTARVIRIDTATGATWHQCTDSRGNEMISDAGRGRADACKEVGPECEGAHLYMLNVMEMGDKNGSIINRWCPDEEGSRDGSLSR